MSRAKLAVAVALGTVSTLGVMVFSLAGVNVVMAQVASGNYPAIVTNIAAKFNLKEADVQAVFESTRTQKETERLDKAVTDGKITAEQKTLIVNKQAETKTKLDEINNKQLTEAERRTQTKAVMDEVEKWATDNKIPARMMMMMGKGRGLEMRAEFGGEEHP